MNEIMNYLEREMKLLQDATENEGVTTQEIIAISKEMRELSVLILLINSNSNEKDLDIPVSKWRVN